MNCRHCGSHLLETDSLCFYFQNEHSVSLIVKQEQYVTQLKNFKLIDDSRRTSICCTKCQNVVGKSVPCGPNNTTYMAFGNEKVILLNVQLDKKKQPWSAVYNRAPFDTIQVRNDATFLGQPAPPKYTSNPKPSPTRITTRNINFPTEIEHYFYTDLLQSDVIPRDYQIAAYVEALQRDLIVVIPTGAGKTLISTIVAARMRNLNPKLMVLFLAERVPLVFQQGEAISFDTRMDVCCLSSENNTRLKLRELQEGEYDVLVSTAGAYINLEQELVIDGFCCVVFDECHHATKSHNYVKVLEKIKRIPVARRPRVIGLTASPPSVKGDYSGTRQLLDEMRANFFSAPIYYNRDLEISAYMDKTIEKIIVPITKDGYFYSYTQLLKYELKRMANVVNGLTSCYRIIIEDWGSNKGRLQLIKMLSHLQKSCKGEVNTIVKSMRTICTALDFTEMLGITYANNILKDLGIYSSLNTSTCLSPRLESLLELLDKLPNASKIIIFVQTRQIAQILSTILKDSGSVNAKFSPLKIVGQYGALGMCWDTEQKGILEKFRLGNCNLLVSTSVLEEGLDVPECNVVIRFDGIMSLTSFKQSKGRARKRTGSRFIMILSDEDEAAFNEILDSEAIVRQVLETQYSICPIPTDVTLKIRDHIVSSTKTSSPNADIILQSTNCVIELYISGSEGIADLLEHIYTFFSQKHFLTVRQIDEAKSEWKSKGIFQTSIIVFTLEIESKHNIYPLYKRLTTGWDFKLGTNSVWSRILVPPNEEPITKPSWFVTSVQWGKFENSTSFIVIQQHANINGILKFVFTESSTGSYFQIITPIFTIQIYFLTIHRFILAHWTDDDVTLYLPLNSNPIFLDSKLKRLTGGDLSKFGECPVIVLTVRHSKSNWSHLMSFLHSSNNFSVPVFDSRIISLRRKLIDQSVLSHVNYASREVQDCIWAFSVLKDSRLVCIPDDTISLIYRAARFSVSTTIALWRVYVTISNPKTCYFMDFISEFQKQHQYVINKSLSPPKIPPNFTELQCAIVTPSHRVICLPPLLTQSNRLFRKYPQYQFLNIAFRDEQLQNLQGESSTKFVKDIIQIGIEINGDKFDFLLCSGSQLRSKHAIFLLIQDITSAVKIVQQIRFELIGNSEIYNKSKYLSRLGLFLTSDYPTVFIEQYATFSLPDLFATNQLMLTDGAGKIAKSLSDKVVKQLNDENQSVVDTPSAFQIRLAGLKGVLTVCNDFSDPDFRRYPHHSILYRESMKKIDWTHSTLCIVKYAKYNECFLNVQVINLITSLMDSSGTWSPEPRIKYLFQSYIQSIGIMFTDSELAGKELTTNLANYSKPTIEHFDILNEPYFLSLLRCIYAYKVNSLVQKFRIPVKDGCLLMGIPDPIGVLRDGEVYIRFQIESKIFILRGRVLVYKNPCLHPGDLLTPTAVEVQALSHLINVIVFPITGKTSLPACSGGSDLDGDEFSIIWDKDLIPPVSAIVEPLNYSALTKVNPFEKPIFKRNVDVAASTLVQTDPAIRERLANIYYTIVSGNSLGKICLYHLSICDQMPDGACDPLSIELAKAASIAVDSPKTGLIPIIPEEAANLVQEKGYPDFMNKPLCPSYPSTKLLGELYRIAKSTCYDTTQWVNILNFHRKCTLKGRVPGTRSIRDFHVQGYQRYMSDALFRYHEYSNAMRRIMLSFGVETEAEVMTGLIMDCHPLLSADKGRITASLRTAVKYLVDEFLEIFHRDTSGSELHVKASAWYMATYQQRGDVFLSFPWIVAQYLCDIVPQRRIREVSLLHSSIGKSAKEYICKNSDYITSLVKSKLSVLPSIESCINEYMRICFPSVIKFFEITAFGSVSVYLCEQQSDLDLSISLSLDGERIMSRTDGFMTLTAREQRAHLLNTYIQPCVSEIANKLVIKVNSETPIISLTMDSPQEDVCIEVEIDIAIKSDGVLKSQYLQQHFVETQGLFFGWLWIIVHWARHVGILKFTKTQESNWIILTAEFEALALFIYDQMSNKPIYQRKSVSDLSFDDMIRSIISGDIDCQLGKMLLEFFSLGAEITSRNSDITYTWPVDGNPTHTIHEGALKHINTMFFQAWHCLVFTRDILKLFDTNLQNNLTLKRRFSIFISDQLRQSREFNRVLLEKKTGASISFEQVGRHLVLTAVGSAKSIHQLNIEINLIEKNVALSPSYRTRARNYMLEGCIAIVMRNQTESTRVELKYHTSMYKLHHIHNVRSYAVIANPSADSNSKWQEYCVKILQNLAWSQLKRFPVDNISLLECLQFKTRFGFFYILDGEDALRIVGGSLKLEEFEKCLLNGKKFTQGLLSTYLRDCNPSKLNIDKPTNSSNTSSKTLVSFSSRKLREQRPKAISSAFCPGVYTGGNGYECDVRTATSVYHQALVQCGFAQSDLRNDKAWRIDLKGTVNRDFHIDFDEKFEIVRIGERPFIWMLATVVGDRSSCLIPERVHDIRLRMESYRTLDQNSELFKHLFPDGIPSPILSLGGDNDPIFNRHLKGRVKLIKHNSISRFYKLDNTTAKVCSGIEYDGNNTQIRRIFCEMSLYHSELELREAITDGCVINEVQSIIAKAMNISLNVSNAISIMTNNL